MNDDLLKRLEFFVDSILEAEDSCIRRCLWISRFKGSGRHIFFKFFGGQLHLVLWLVDVQILVQWQTGFAKTEAQMNLYCIKIVLIEVLIGFLDSFGLLDSDCLVASLQRKVSKT